MNEVYRVAYINFFTSDKPYAYLCPDENIKEGDYVVLEGYKSKKRITHISVLTKNELPCLPSYMKKVLYKVESYEEEKQILKPFDRQVFIEDKAKEKLNDILKKFPFMSKIDSDIEIYGRDEEIDFLLESLHKKRMKNSILIGPAGCGKTAILENFAKIIKKDYLVINYDIPSLVSGTSLRGDLEEKITSSLRAIRNYSFEYKKVILFIDEIHMIYNAGQCHDNDSGTFGQIVKPYLSKGEITIIGATTKEEYLVTIAKDKALNRRLSPLFIEELSKQRVLEIADKFSDYSMDFDLLEYIYDKSLEIKGACNPDITLEIVDRCMAKRDFKKVEIDIKMVNNVIKILKEKEF